jgi:hypothetical protein
MGNAPFSGFDSYAALECRLATMAPSARKDTLAREGLSELELARLRVRWDQQFAADPALAAKFNEQLKTARAGQPASAPAAPKPKAQPAKQPSVDATMMMFGDSPFEAPFPIAEPAEGTKSGERQKPWKPPTSPAVQAPSPNMDQTNPLPSLPGDDTTAVLIDPRSKKR